MTKSVRWTGWVVGAVMGIAAVAGEPAAPEYDIKAAYLVHFANLCEWPTNAFPASDSPFVIGVLGRDPFGAALEKVLRGKSAGGRQFTVKRYRQLDEIGGCQLLFVSASEKDRLDRILAALAGRPVFTVSDLDEFAEHGGVARLFPAGRNIRFAVNPAAAEKAQLKLSSKLLRLATIVPAAKGGGE